MQEDNSLESLLPDKQSTLHFHQDSYIMPEQLFADSSASDSAMDDVVQENVDNNIVSQSENIINQDINQEVTTNNHDIITNKNNITGNQNTIITGNQNTITGNQNIVTGDLEITNDHITTDQHTIKEPPINPEPPTPQPSLISKSTASTSVNSQKVTTLPVSSDALIQGNKKILLIPMSQVPTSMLQNNPLGPSMVILNRDNILQTVDGKNIKLFTTNTPLVGKGEPPQSIVINQQKFVLQNSTLTSSGTTQALPNTPAQVTQAGKNIQARSLSEASIVGKNVGVSVAQSRQVSHPANSQEKQTNIASNSFNQSGTNCEQAGTSSGILGSDLDKLSPVKTVVPSTGSPVTSPNISFSEAQNVISIMSKLVDAEKQMTSTKTSTATQNIVSKSNTVSSPMQPGLLVTKVHQPSPEKAVVQVPSKLQSNYPKKLPQQTTQGEITKSPFASIPKQTVPIPPHTVVKPGQIVRPTGIKIQSNTPIVQPGQQVKPPTTSVWPSTSKTVIPLGYTDPLLPKRGWPCGQATNNNGTVPVKMSDGAKNIDKIDITKGPTVQEELERKGASISGRTRGLRFGESQLKPLKNSKVTPTNLWTCSLCGKEAYELSLGCLFGPYDENKDSMHGDSQAGRKRKHSSTDECESPTKSKSDSGHELWFHADCVIWSPGICAVGELLAGYRQATNDARFSKCSCCGNFGASLACLQRNCKKFYHFSCAKEEDCVFDESNYTIQCGHHK